MRQIAGIAAAAGVGTETVYGKLLVAVLAVHLVALLFVPLFGFVAGIAGVKGGLYAAVRRLCRKEGDFFAAIDKFVEVSLAVSKSCDRYCCN